MIGTRLGPYEVIAKIGAGGMGEVYRAADSVLKRTVALKVLHASVAGDAERLARFQREAEALAALNHPNIAGIHGVESSGSTRALVMEFVDGPTLADRTAAGPIAFVETLTIAAQIAGAVEAAHERGIVHRDLKPANIKVRDDGTVKVLDFGLAKIGIAETGGGSGAEGTGGQTAANSPTLTAVGTQMGMIIGTAAYMAPEQAKGRPVDKRADIWAFGCVLYEMLTGRRAFAGDDVTEILAAVIRDTPDFAALPPDTPRRLRQLVERCLVRDPKSRLRDIGEARIELAAIASAPAGTEDAGTAAASQEISARPLPWLAAGLAAGLAIGSVIWMLAGRGAATDAAPPVAGRFQLTLPADVELTGFSGGWLSVSPDGRSLAFFARKGAEATQLWLRALDSTNATPLPGTEGSQLPFWSPDGAHLGFFANSKLKRLDLRTNAVTTICDAANPGGGTWNAEDTIVFAPMIEGPLYRVSAGGGTPSQLTSLDANEVESNHMWPHFLPDGRTYLFQVLGLKNTGIYAGTLDGATRTLVLPQNEFDLTAVQYSSSGHLVYVRNRQLVARPFDLDRLTFTGNETAIADGFSVGGPGRPYFGISRGGVLAFRPAGENAVYQPTWYSRTGVQQGTIGAQGQYVSMDLSRDGRTLAITRNDSKDSGTWLIDVESGRSTRFTTEKHTADPVWFPDGDRLAYVAVRDTPPNPFVKTLAGVETRLARLPKAVVLGSVTPDGSAIIGEFLEPATGDDLWLFPTAPAAAPAVFLQSQYNEHSPSLSPDGTWLAFTSDESGTNAIYVTTFPKAGRLYRVSSEGGTSARWATDKEILFRSGRRVMSATFGVDASGAPVIGTPRELFTLPEAAATDWALAAGGQKLLFNLRVTPRQAAPMTVLINWPAMVVGK